MLIIVKIIGNLPQCIPLSLGEYAANSRLLSVLTVAAFVVG